MESRLVRGLFFAGEVVDVDGDTGGYNLQWAFSSAWLAAQEILRCTDRGCAGGPQ
jgi:predicted flavoprotein YhiN